MIRLIYQLSKGLKKLLHPRYRSDLSLTLKAYVVILSSANDPRYHDLDFLRSEQREKVARVLLEKIEKDYQETEKTTEIIEEPSTKKKKSNEKETAMSFL